MWFKKCEKDEYKKGLDGQIATQLMRMYRTAKRYTSPTILELGTDRGQSTVVFLQACEEVNGRLVSVDIKDCSTVSNSKKWTFVKSDSTNLELILSKAPNFKRGIDILYVDSLHKASQVKKELESWYPFMNEGSHIFFDDVDSHPYRKGQRKENVDMAKSLDDLKEYVEEFFYANEDTLYLEIMYGTTGLAHIIKLSPKGTLPNAIAG